MERNEFLKSLGLGVALVCTGSCLSGCGSKGDNPEPNNQAEAEALQLAQLQVLI
jgi:hypothetical protein